MQAPIHVLLIEDSEDDGLLILRALKIGGFEPSYARVTTEAELRAQLVDDKWDIAISDFNIGSFNGFEALRIVKERNEDLPFILVSGTVGEEVAVNAMRSGAQDYIMKDNLTRLTAAVGRELAERKNRQESRRQLAIRDEEVRQAQKMEIMGRIAGGLAHDFNNILGVVGLCTDKVLSEVREPDLRECLENISQAHQRGATLVRQLMTIGRKTTPKRGLFDLNRIIENLKSMMAVGLGRQNELCLKLGAECANLEGDANQIEQVLMNLVLNSRDAISESGRVVIETENIREKIKLTVSDNGSGMDKPTLSRLFEPFFTTKEVGKGTGIGLATVYAIIKQHGGTISVKSEPGNGTAFQMEFPLAKTGDV